VGLGCVGFGYSGVGAMVLAIVGFYLGVCVA
jgi:hypothetical protein